jgi:hypothetical protein
MPKSPKSSRRVSTCSAFSAPLKSSVLRDATAMTRRPRVAISFSACSACPSSRHRANTASVAPLTNSRSPATMDIRRHLGSKGKRLVAGTSRACLATSTPSRRAKTSSATSMGSPCPTQPPSRWQTRPLEHRAATSAASRIAGRACASARTVPTGSYPTPSIAAEPSGVQTSSTDILFSVNVPVLSVQMKVVEPSVSTDSSLRTSACRAALRCAPIASASVTVGSKPSGTRATVTPTANKKPSLSRIPTSTAIIRNTAPTAEATRAITRTTRLSS